MTLQASPSAFLRLSRHFSVVFECCAMCFWVWVFRGNTKKVFFFFSSGRFWVSNPIQKTKHALLLCNSLVTFSHACFSNLVPIVNEVFNNHEKKEYGHTSVRHRSVRHVDRTTPEIFSLRRLTLTTPNQKGKCSVFVSRVVFKVV